MERRELRFSIAEASFEALPFLIGGVVVLVPSLGWMAYNLFCGFGLSLVPLLLFGVAGLWIPRIANRQVQVLIDQEGIHDYRGGQGLIPWHDVSELRLRGARNQGSVMSASLVCETLSGRVISVDIEGLDETPESIYAIARVAAPPHDVEPTPHAPEPIPQKPDPELVRAAKKSRWRQ